MDERDQAQAALGQITWAQRRVRRHTINNGRVPLVWGVVILLTLPLYDIFPRGTAALCLAVVPVLTALWTVWYRRYRAAIRPLPAAKRVYTRLILGWGAYYVALMVLWETLAQPRLHLGLTLLAPIVAAPLLIGGWIMWRRTLSVRDSRS